LAIKNKTKILKIPSGQATSSFCPSQMSSWHSGGECKESLYCKGESYKNILQGGNAKLAYFVGDKSLLHLKMKGVVRWFPTS
jgi:hypothetical protein